MKPYMNKSFYTSPYFVLSLLLLAPFSIFAFGVAEQSSWLTSFDRFFASPILVNRSPVKTTFYSLLTDLGGTFFIVLLTILVGLYFILRNKDSKTAYWFVFNVAFGAGLLNQLVKFLFQRTRPTIEHLVVQDGYSFPSGHSMASLICYGGIAFLIIQFTRKKWIKWLVGLLAALIIIIIGISRIYLGVHFPSDVVGGFCLAGSWLSLSTAFYSNKIRSQR
ncbi:MAG: phosphatase PAP2 family protein [Carnobacterium sp.]|uniref:phosphatase PAP2 family protein n=1 Tax=Carnobacterium sp. TaxID=48221 RepID=UPI003316339E